MSLTNRCCRECSKLVKVGSRPDAVFCSDPCRLRWNNRRKLRGAELYDAFMIYRYQRGTAKLLGIWSLICRMASVWNEDDKAAGRQSYNDPEEIKLKFIHYTATRVHKGR